jgi:4-alpha-glucanotransferase
MSDTLFPRASGVLVHPTSFPGRFGIGDLGPGARTVIDFLAAGHQRLWQVLPLGPTGYGDSPYASFSAFAGNHLLISPDGLVEQGWLRPGELDDAPRFSAERVEFAPVTRFKMALLRRAHERFREGASRIQHDELGAFREANRGWLDDYALFMALKDAHEGIPWTSWEPALVARQPQALAEARAALAGDVALHEFLQWVFFSQWAALRAYAHARGVRVVGDVAIFVAHDSADVWAHRELFALDERGMPTIVAGVPPDYFSRTGQRWGNPLYRWDVLAQSGYAWWIDRVRAALALAELLRLDHFRGFQAYWEVPATCPTAVQGRWVKGPGAELFEAIARALGPVPIIAEDLGKITPAVRRMRESLGYPGMRVLQFAFGGDARNKHLPHWFTHDSVIYTGTHDNDTAVGWFRSRGPHERDFVLRYTGSDGREINWDLIRLAFASVADTAIVPLQDVLGLGSEARMNTPGTPSGNWAWRCTEQQLEHAASARLAALTATYGR